VDLVSNFVCAKFELSYSTDFVGVPDKFLKDGQGRASALQAGGRQFNSGRLHQIAKY